MFLILTSIITVLLSASSSSSISTLPTPTPWPLQFHSILFVNFTYSSRLQIFNLWYDYPNGRNLLTMQDQLSNEVRYDLEWNNGTSYYYTLDYDDKKCSVLHFPVGILRPNWLDGGEYLGKVEFDGFVCHVWEKVDFVWYYEDVVTRMPVYWRFYNGMIFHVMTFEVGSVLEDSKWQAPVYCFGNNNTEESTQPLNQNANAPHKPSFLRMKIDKNSL